MKFTCQRDTILKEIEYANNFTSQRNALSILSYVLLENYQNVLTIKSSDTKLSFMTSFPVSTEIPGSITVTCDKFLAILKTLPSSDIVFSDENEKMTISPIGDKSVKFNLKTISADKFTQIKFLEDDTFFSLSQRDFFDMIDKTTFAVSTDETKYFLTGAYLEKKDGQLIMVATDGKRLSCIKKIFEQEVPDFPASIIPVKFLQMLTLIGSGEGIFSLSIGVGVINANINGHLISSSLVSGNYPAYERVIPKDFTYECKIKKEDMLTALTRVSLFVENNSKKIFLDINQDGILVSGENTEVGDAREIVGCEYNGPEARMSFNYNFLLTPLKKIESEYFRICYNTTTSAIGVLPDPERDYIFVIMPMHG